MKTIITGASGLIGRHIYKVLRQRGADVNRLVRQDTPQGDGDVSWDPATGRLDPCHLEGYECVVHLAGESVVGIWTGAKKHRIRSSRLNGTRLLASTISELKAPPRLLICASAAGYYGDRGDETLTELSSPGAGFLPQVCEAWEKESDVARNAGVRVVKMRFPIVLTTTGGALARILPFFRLGLGGTLGPGTQFMSWCTLNEVGCMAAYICDHENLEGPVNVGTPNPVTNTEFTRTLGRVLGRPSFFRIPAFMLNLLPGGMAKEMLLASARTRPDSLLEAGYQFQDQRLEPALRAMLTDYPDPADA